MCLRNRAKAVDAGIPNAVNIICHHVEPIQIGLHPLEIEAAEVPIGGRLPELVTIEQRGSRAERGCATYESQTNTIFSPRRVQARPQTSQKVDVIVKVGRDTASVLCHRAKATASVHNQKMIIT